MAGGYIAREVAERLAGRLCRRSPGTGRTEGNRIVNESKPAGRALIRIALCGSLIIEIDGRDVAANLPGRQSRLLFAYLVLHRERAVRRDELVAVLWPEEPPRSADNVLNSVLSRVRKVLGEGLIAGRSQISLQLPPDSRVDLEEAFEEIQRAELAVQRSEWRTAEVAASLSLSVAERGFLSEADGAWADEARRRLQEFRLRALECLAAAGLGQGGSRLSATERAARTLIEASPYRETGYRYLMQALAERGRVAEALRLFDEFRRLVQEELGVPPSAGLRSLHKRLLSDEGVPPQTEREDPLAVDTATSALFTDLAGQADLDPERARALRRAHARVLRQAVASQGGRGVTDTGDGLIATFKNAPTAIRCAVEMQQAAELHNRRQPARTLAIRIAVNASGAPAETARRLCARAEAGQILVADVAPSAAREVPWEPVAPQPFALPPALSQHKRDIFGSPRELWVT